MSDERDPHMRIDAVAVSENNDENEYEDIELYFRKTLLESDSEWKMSTTATKLIDTKPWRGNV